MAFRQKMWKHNSTDIHYTNNIMLYSYILYVFGRELKNHVADTMRALGKTANDIAYRVSIANLSHFLFWPWSPSPTHLFGRVFIDAPGRASGRAFCRHGRHIAHDIILYYNEYRESATCSGRVGLKSIHFLNV